MPLVNLRYPAVISSVNLKELNRWGKHTTDNYLRLNNALHVHSATLTNGTEYSFKNPLLGTPRAVYASCQSSTLQLTSWRYDTTTGKIIVQPLFPGGNNYLELYLTSNTSLLNSAETSIAWHALRTTVGNGLTHSTTVNPTRIIATRTMRLRVAANITWLSSAVGVRQGWVTKNAGTGPYSRKGATATVATAAEVIMNHTTSDWDLDAGDYVEVWARQSSGGALSIAGGTERSCTVFLSEVGMPASYSAECQLLVT